MLVISLHTDYFITSNEIITVCLRVYKHRSSSEIAWNRIQSEVHVARPYLRFRVGLLARANPFHKTTLTWLMRCLSIISSLPLLKDLSSLRQIDRALTSKQHEIAEMKCAICTIVETEIVHNASKGSRFFLTNILTMILQSQVNLIVKQIMMVEE